MTDWYDDFIADDGSLGLNVVGEIPGRDPSKVYLLAGHFDSIADDVPEGHTAPGALNDATVIACLAEVARILSGYRLEHLGAPGPLRRPQRRGDRTAGGEGVR